MPVFVQWAFMRTRYNFQRAIFFADFVDKKKHGYHVVIGVRFEKKILVILYLGCGTRLFGINFGIFEFDIWTQNIDNGVKCAVVPHKVKIGLRYFNRRGNATQCRLFR